MPLFHVGGFAITYRVFRAGATVVLEPSFEAGRVAGLLSSISYASFVPTMLRAVLGEIGEGSVPGPSPLALVGGAAVADGLQEAASAAGISVVATYGLTETASQIATARPGDRPAAGAPLLEGVVIEAGTEGIPQPITVDGPMVSPGYWGEPDRGGAFGTADVGFLDGSGRLHVLGRADDMIITGGENVHPAEVVAALERLPAIRAAAVFGVPDPEWGERIEAAVVLADAAAPLDEVEGDLRQNLSAFKIPRAFHVVPDLPLSPSGKLDRSALAAIIDPPTDEVGESEEGPAAPVS